MLLKPPICLLASVFMLLSIFAKAQSTDSIAQPAEFNKIISFNLLGPGILYSLNHTWVIQRKTASKLLFQINAKYRTPKNSAYNKKNMFFLSSFSLIKQFGRKNSHFHIGIGHSFVFEKTYYSFYDLEIKQDLHNNYINWGYLFGDIGYCYWNPTRRFYFKFSLNPIYQYQEKQREASRFFGERIAPWFGLTFGYSYGKKSINSYLATNTSNFKRKLAIGYENDIGYAELKCLYGKGNGLVISNFVNIQYSPSRLFFNVKLGNSFYGIQKVKGETGNEVTIFDKSLSFWNVGFGIGCRLFDIKGWYVSPEITGGTYLADKVCYIFNRAPSAYAISDLTSNILYEDNYFYNMRFLGLSVQAKKQISNRLEVSAGFQYKTSNDLAMKEYTSVFSINYLLL